MTKIIVPPIKCQGIKTKLVPWIHEIIPEHFNGLLCPKERLDALAKFLPFITPKIQSLKDKIQQTFNTKMETFKACEAKVQPCLLSFCREARL